MSTKTVPALIARTQFGSLLDKVSTGEIRYFIQKKGEVKAVIMSVEDYYLNIIKKPSVLKEIQKEAKRSGLDKLSEKQIIQEVKKAKKALWS